jgi:hypothetical protein
VDVVLSPKSHAQDAGLTDEVSLNWTVSGGAMPLVTFAVKSAIGTPLPTVM